MPVPIWSSFTANERRNMAFYIGGIMLYKLGLESFNGSIVTLATDRFGGGSTFAKLGALTGLNQAMQVIGSIMIAPLMKRFPTRSVLSYAIIVFALIVSLFLIIDAGTGGKIKANNGNKIKYGSWNPNALFPLYMISGISYGMVELIRRVIPRDIVGGDVVKLRKMDAIVHILYEVAGTCGALLSVALIKKLGNNFSFIITPFLFILAAVSWRFVGSLGHQTDAQRAAAVGGLAAVDAVKEKGYGQQLLAGFKAFGRSFYKGAIICFTSRKFVWLPFAYSLALYGHRYLENGISPAIAKRVMLDSSYSQIMVTGSNAGELVGAVIVLFFGTYITTPMPFLRFDALALLIVWVLPSYTQKIVPNQVSWAWKIAGIFAPVSIGWASGDVSLAAFIQASLAKIESEDAEVSALGAVMAFLYSTYIIVYAVAGSLLGKYVDKVFKEDKNITRALTNIGGVHFTVLSAIILASTFIPKGSLALNPKLINDIDMSKEAEAEANTDYTLKKSNTGAGSDDENYEKPMKATDVGAML